MWRISWIIVGVWVGEGFVFMGSGAPFPKNSTELIFKRFED